MPPTLDLVLESREAHILVREAVAECRPDVVVEAFTAAADAMPALRDHGCDLLLIDWISGGATSLEAVDRLRRCAAEVPVVVLTHAARDADVEACAGHRCLVVEYPDSFDGLVERLRLLLEVYAPPRALAETA